MRGRRASKTGEHSGRGREKNPEIVLVTLILAFGTTNAAGKSKACLEMMASGAVNVDTLISAVVPLADGVAWFERLGKREPGLMKVILTPETEVLV